MSGSFPRFLPPASAMLMLWPMPPRARSSPQSPDRSGILVDAPWPAVVPRAACPRSVVDIVITAINATADVTRRIRMTHLLTSPTRLPFGRRRGGRRAATLTGNIVGHQFLAVGEHDLRQIGDRCAILGRKDVDRHLFAGLNRLHRPTPFQHDEGWFSIRHPMSGAFLIGDVEEDLVVGISPSELRDGPLQFCGLAHVE